MNDTKESIGQRVCWYRLESLNSINVNVSGNIGIRIRRTTINVIHRQVVQVNLKLEIIRGISVCRISEMLADITNKKLTNSVR